MDWYSPLSISRSSFYPKYSQQTLHVVQGRGNLPHLSLCCMKYCVILGHVISRVYGNTYHCITAEHDHSIPSSNLCHADLLWGYFTNWHADSCHKYQIQRNLYRATVEWCDLSKQVGVRDKEDINIMKIEPGKWRHSSALGETFTVC